MWGKRGRGTRKKLFKSLARTGKGGGWNLKEVWLGEEWAYNRRA